MKKIYLFILILLTFSMISSAGSWQTITTAGTSAGLINAPLVITISGPSSVCAGSTGNVYTTESGMTNYVWTVTPGGTITAGGSSTSNTVTVTWNTAGAQSVSVLYTDTFGYTPPSPTIYPVTVNPITVPTLTGPTPVCAGTTGNIYITQSGMTNYVWSVSAGGSVTAGGTSTSNTVTVTWNTAGARTVSVNYTNSFGCTSASPSVYPVTVNALPAPSISGNNNVCIGTTGVVYTTQGGMTNYIWSVSAGGTITGGGTSTSNTVTVTWNITGPQTVSVNYTNSNGCTAATPTVYPVSVNPLPVPTITGNNSVCVGATGVVYTTQTGMTNYIWSVSAGGTITAGGTSTSNTVTVTWNTTGAKTVSVNYTNSNGCTAVSPTVYAITVNPLPVPTITGTNSVCAGTTGVVYTTQAGMTNYTWSVSAGGTITSGGTTTSNTVTVTWNTAGLQTVSVNYANSFGCMAASPTVYAVTVNPLPVPTITGNNIVCTGTTGVVYTTQAGMTNYVWNVSAGGTITAGGTSTSSTVTVTWNTAGARTVSVNYTNSNGCTAVSPTVYNVTVNLSPSPTITGINSVCAGTTGVVYTTEAGMTNYVWSVSTGGTITAGGTSTNNTVTVTWNTAGAQTVSVNYTNSVGCPAPSPTVYAVTVNPLPVPTITGNNNVCIGATGVVYTSQSGMNNYVWSVSAGGTVTAGGTTTSNTVTVTWNTTGAQTVSVNYTTSNGCTAASPTVYAVTVNPLPVPTITGNNNVCAGTTGVVYTTQAGMTNYLWTVSAGGTVTAGGTSSSNTVTVTWNTAGAQTVSVNYTNLNGCTALSPTVYNVTVNPAPTPTITGNNSVCAGTAGLVYTTESSMTNYVWNVSAGGTITAGGTSTSNTVTVTWNTAGSQTVSVNYAFPGGCAAASPTVFLVTVNPLPVPTITGNGVVCVDSTGNVYTTETGMTNYIWTVSAGGTVTAGGTPTSNTVTVTWNMAGTDTVRVNYTNSAGCTALTPTVYLVTVNPLPDSAAIITGPDSVCGGATNVHYSVAVIPNTVTYVWTLPAGATIISGNGTDSITVNFASNASSGVISVMGSNSCGNGVPSPDFPLTILQIAVQPDTINGPTLICIPESGVLYTVAAVPGATGYTWTVPAGATIVGGLNTDSITVDFSSNAVSGVIHVAATNICGTSPLSPDLEITVHATPPPPIIAITAGELQSSSPLGNQWVYEGTDIPGATNQTYLPVISGDYWDYVTQNGCPSDTSNHVYVIIVGTEIQTSDYNFTVYPVPNDGSFTVLINYPGEEIFTIKVCNTIGLTVYTGEPFTVTSTLKKFIDLGNVPAGLYYVIIKNSQGQGIRKILVYR